jgi:hypothetical protein
MTNPTGATHERGHAAILLAITLPSFLLALLCFQWYASTDEIALLLLGLVTFGMAYDFLSHILGLYAGHLSGLLRWYARINYWALCFGIPFTAFAGIFIMARIAPDSISARLADHYLIIFHSSVIFGALFLFARYKAVRVGGAVEFVLDKSQRYTNAIFLTRRILLALSLVLGIIVMIDGWNTDFRIWSLLFGCSFIASVPLHIMHKQIPSMLSELATQVIAIYGSWQVFVA